MNIFVLKSRVLSFGLGIVVLGGNLLLKVPSNVVIQVVLTQHIYFPDNLLLPFFLAFSIQPVYGAQHPPLDPRLTKK